MSDSGHCDEHPMIAFYGEYDEAARLQRGMGQLEFVRTHELIERFAPRPPAVVLDVGGGPGTQACPLARRGYEVHLIDPVERHLEQAREASGMQPEHALAGIAKGDAREIEWPDESADMVLFCGPLYHLTQRDDRVRALREARRVLRPGGLVFAAAITRFGSMFAGLTEDMFDDPEFVEIMRRDLREGQHRNPTERIHYFTMAYFHRPEELTAEIADAGLELLNTFSVEGPGWLWKDFDRHWVNPDERELLLEIVRKTECEPSIQGVSPHWLAVARRG